MGLCVGHALAMDVPKNPGSPDWKRLLELALAGSLAAAAEHAVDYQLADPAETTPVPLEVGGKVNTDQVEGGSDNAEMPPTLTSLSLKLVQLKQSPQPELKGETES